MKRNKHTLTAKQKAFAHKFIETKNATESVRGIYDVANDDVAKSIASENLSKPYLREYIHDIMKRNSVDIDDVVSIHKRNMLQDTHLPTSQKAVADFYNVLGVTEQKTDTRVQVAFVLEEK
jgi:phage terminase small subunit